MQLGSSSPSTTQPRPRRRLERYPFVAQVRIGWRTGTTSDMSSMGLAFHSADPFAPNELLRIAVTFEDRHDGPVEVVRPARVVWIQDDGREWHIGVEFLD